MYQKLNSKKERNKSSSKYQIFTKKSKELKNKVVFLVDDSFVTGSTIERVRKVLISEFGVKKVYIYVFLNIKTKHPSDEHKASSFIRRKKYFGEFVELLSDKKLQISRYLLKSLFLSNYKELGKISSSLSNKKKKLLAKYGMKYFSSFIKNKNKINFFLKYKA